jgi:GNAT superfamily N-acetyltransferase
MLDIRSITKSEMVRLLAWAGDENWNPGLGDAEAFHAADPQGFLIGYLGDEPIAGISAVAASEAFGFIGFYLCRPEHRGAGHGMAMWNAGIERLGSRTIGLDGVIAEQENYVKSGFKLAHRNVRFTGKIHQSHKAMVDIGPFLDGDLVPLVAFDGRHYGAERTGFLTKWLNCCEGRTARLARRGNEIVGYGVIRACRNGFKIGPLFAVDANTAQALFLDLAVMAQGQLISIDIPLPNGEAVSMVKRHGFEPAFETARMYRGHPPDLPLANIFGITTFELG